MRTAYCILAAGQSKRLGKPKQLLPFKGGTLLEHCIQKVIEGSGEKPFLVLGAHADKIEECLNKETVQMIYNKDFETGMGSSIKSALVEIQNNFEAMMIIPCDQPLVPTNHFQILKRTLIEESTKLVFSAFADQIGPPCIIHKDLFSSLVNIPNNSGAKKHLLASCNGNYKSVMCPRAEWDIDTPADVERYLKE